MSESEEEEEATGPFAGEDSDVFLFDNNIPSISTRIPASAEPTDTLALRRRNRIMRLVSESGVCSRELQRSVSVQLDDRRRRCRRNKLSMSFAAGGHAGHLSKHLTPPSDPDNDDYGDDDEVDGQRKNFSRGRGAQNRPSLTNGSGSWSDLLNHISVDACCSGGSADVSTLKRRGTLTAAKMGTVDDDLGHDDDDDDDDDDNHDNAELASRLCNGLDDQPKNTCSASECSQKAN